MKAYLFFKNGIYFTSKKSYEPKDALCECPKVNGEYVLDPDCMDISGNVATFNQEKADAKQIVKQEKFLQLDAKNAIQRQRRKFLKNSMDSFDSKTAAEKWALVKKLIEVL